MVDEAVCKSCHNYFGLASVQVWITIHLGLTVQHCGKLWDCTVWHVAKYYFNWPCVLLWSFPTARVATVIMHFDMMMSNLSTCYMLSLQSKPKLSLCIVTMWIKGVVSALNWQATCPLFDFGMCASDLVALQPCSATLLFVGDNELKTFVCHHYWLCPMVFCGDKMTSLTPWSWNCSLWPSPLTYSSHDPWPCRSEGRVHSLDAQNSTTKFYWLEQLQARRRRFSQKRTTICADRAEWTVKVRVRRSKHLNIQVILEGCFLLELRATVLISWKKTYPLVLWIHLH